jgi:hypothetical protein
VSGAGCPRVTHPFAALPSEGLPLLRFPLDLHVLGTPPAFVLSQDQTLRREPLDPAVKAGFGFVVGKSASPSSTPGSAFLWCSFVRPSSRQARRTAPPEINGVNALAFGTLFSSQGASADPKEGTPRRWGRATHHGRHAGRGRQPNSCPDPALVVRPRIPAGDGLERSFGPTTARSLSGGSVRGRYRFEYAWTSPPFPRHPELLCPDLGPLHSDDIAQIRLRGRPS